MCNLKIDHSTNIDYQKHNLSFSISFTTWMGAREGISTNTNKQVLICFASYFTCVICFDYHNNHAGETP